MLVSSKLTIIEQLVVSGTQFIVMLLLARFWGMAEFGRFSVVFMLLILCMDLCRSVVTQPLMSSAKQERKAAHILSVLYMTFGLWILLAIGLFGVQQWSKYFLPQWGLRGLYGAALLFITTRVCSDMLRGVHYSYQTPAHALLQSAVISLCSLVAVAAVVLTNTISDAAQPLILLGLAHAAGVLVGLALLLLPVRTQLRLETGEWHAIWQEHKQFGLWASFTALTRWLQGNFLMLVAASLLGAPVIGAIRAMQTILSPLGVLFQALENAIPPQAALLLRDKGNEALARFLVRLAGMLSLLAVMAVAVLWLFREPIVSLLLGEEYLTYEMLILILGAANILSVSSLMLSFYFKTHQRTKPLFKANLVNAVLCIITAYPLIHFAGINGFAIGIIAFQIILTASLLYLRKEVQHG